MKITQTLSQFYQWLQFYRNVKSDTIQHYERILQIFVRDIGDLKIQKIRIEDIWHWREKLNERNIVPQTQRKYLLSIRVFLKFCQEKKLLKIDLNKITLPQVVKKKVEYLENGEVKTFVESINDLKYRAIAECLLGTGVRISELLSLKRKDIKNGEVKIVGKNNQEREVFFSGKALFWLTKYLKTRKDDNLALFVSSRKKSIKRSTVEGFFRQHCKKIGGKRVTPHLFRHTFGSNLVANGADIFFVKELLGHRDIGVTAGFYLGTNKEKLKEIHQKYLNYNK